MSESLQCLIIVYIEYLWVRRIYMAKQKKVSVSFKESEKDLELYNWVTDKAEIIGYSNAIKQILYKVMQDEKALNK